MSEVLSRVIRITSSVRHLMPWQVLGRLYARAKLWGGLTSLPHVPSRLCGHLRVCTPMPDHDPWNTRTALLSGRFRFLNETADLGREVDWRAASMSLLWRFNLHYFSYLHLLRPQERTALCRAWMHANPPGTDVAWHPYPTSLRIVNWCRAGMVDPEVQASLYQQAAYLFRNVETYVTGNHLMENARALVLAGTFFEGQGEASRWLERGLEIFRRETARVVLSDGGFFERSPMYHALMLGAYLDVLNVLRARPLRHALEPVLDQAIARMSDFLASVTRPDGRIALFNDSAHEIAPPSEVLLDYVRRLTGYIPHERCVLPVSGFFVHRSDALHLIIDGGKIAPDHQSADSHSDIFSYELSLAGWPFVVDTGVYEYPAGTMRDYARGTAAHNTVQVDGVDQAEGYGSFRVARRYEPYDVCWLSLKGRSCFEGAFGGYARLIGDGIVHRRKVVVNEARREVVVMDRVEGQGRHRVESRIHLHPDVTIDGGGMQYVLERDGVRCIVDFEATDLNVTGGWYCPEFGKRIPNLVFTAGGTMDLPATLSYRILY